MTAQVTVIDYGCGNLLSVMRAFERCGVTVELAEDPDRIARAERLVLPGVGAFADGMAGLRERSLDEALHRFATSGRPLLGICLGMQMLASCSEEFGMHPGLDLIPGRVVAVPERDSQGRSQKIPLIGWADLMPPVVGSWNGSILGTTEPGTSVYLVHSFHFETIMPEHNLAGCCYGGHRITAAVRKDNLTGCQFHPEKSGEAGLRILSAFLA